MNEATQLTNHWIAFDGPQTKELHDAMFHPPEDWDHVVVGEGNTHSASAINALAKLPALNLSRNVKAQIQRSLKTMMAPYGETVNIPLEPASLLVFTIIAINVTRKA
jgi:hypothetical protein